MKQRLPRWVKSGPVIAVLTVMAFVLGYAIIGATVSIFNLRPLVSSVSRPTEDGAERNADEASQLGVSGENGAGGATASCDEWVANRAFFEIGYYAPDEVALANLERLAPSAAPRSWTVRAFGQPCPGSSLWRASVPLPPGWTGPPQLILPATEGVQFELSDGRHVLLNPAMNGVYISASFIASVVSSDGHPLAAAVLMPTGQNRGFHGRLYVPHKQPLGAFQVWLEAGGTWQGHTISQVGVTDFAGSTPRDVGTFPSSYSCPEGECTPYELESVEYSANGPDEVSLTWLQEGGSRLTATYVLRAGQYQLLSGQEPNSTAAD